MKPLRSKRVNASGTEIADGISSATPQCCRPCGGRRSPAGSCRCRRTSRCCCSAPLPKASRPLTSCRSAPECARSRVARTLLQVGRSLYRWHTCMCAVLFLTSVNALPQVVSGAAANRVQGGCSELITMTEIAQLLAAVTPTDAKELETLETWYMSHIKWTPPPPPVQTEVRPSMHWMWSYCMNLAPCTAPVSLACCNSIAEAKPVCMQGKDGKGSKAAAGNRQGSGK